MVSDVNKRTWPSLPPINVISIDNNLNVPGNVHQPQPITSSELECVLCCRWLRSPITTRCGHTFCRSCLDRVLDHGLGCPLCMGRLSPGHHHTRPPTRLLQECVKRLCPQECHDRELDDVEKDCQVLKSNFKRKKPVTNRNNRFATLKL